MDMRPTEIFKLLTSKINSPPFGFIKYKILIKRSLQSGTLFLGG
jgi:hypothetical protein